MCLFWESIEDGVVVIVIVINRSKAHNTVHIDRVEYNSAPLTPTLKEKQQEEEKHVYEIMSDKKYVIGGIESNDDVFFFYF